MSKTTTKYYRTVVEHQNIKMTFDSETDEIEVVIERRLNNGSVIGTDHMTVHKSYVEPLTAMFNEVLAVEASSGAGEKGRL